MVLRKLFVTLTFCLLMIAHAFGQVPGSIPSFPPASTPFSGSELLHIIQGNIDKQTTVGNLYNIGNLPLTANNGQSATLPAWLGRIPITVNALEGGATCNGTADDTAGINAAIALVNTNGIGTVLIPNNCRVTGTLLLTGSNVTLEGAQPHTRILFANGSNDSIDIGGQVAQIAYIVIKDLYLDHSGKTGGVAVSLNNVAHFTMIDSTIDHAWNGIYAQQTNNVLFESDVINAVTAGNSYALKWYSPDLAHRSDVLTLRNTVLQLNFSGGDGIVWDGMTQTMRIFGVNVLGARYGIHIQNTPQSTSYYPAFLQAVDFEVDGSSAYGALIDAGADLNFVNSDIDNCNSSSVRALQINPDIPYSYTRRITIVDSHIHCATGEAANINARDVIISGSYFFDTNQAGANTAPVLEIGANSDRVNISGTFMGVSFGDPYTPTYGVVVDAGANHVALTGNTYTGATTGSVLNNSSNSVSVLGGQGFDGNPVGPSVVDLGVANSKTFQFFNFGTLSTTKSALELATGSANTYGYFVLQDGPTPLLSLTSGPGVTGGININPASGTILLNSPRLPFTTPANSSVACTAGQFYLDGNYIYVCAGTNTWKRAALATF